MLRVVFSFTVKRVLERRTWLPPCWPQNHGTYDGTTVWIEPIKLYTGDTRSHCLSKRLPRSIISRRRESAEPRYQLSVTRVTRVIAVPSFPFFSFSPSLSLFLSPSTIYVFIRSMATLRHRGRIDICTTNRTRGRHGEAFRKQIEQRIYLFSFLILLLFLRVANQHLERTVDRVSSSSPIRTIGQAFAQNSKRLSS